MERLDDIQARVEKATEGPWGWEETNLIGGSEPRIWYELGPIIPAGYDGPEEIDWTREVCATAGDSDEWEQQQADADFIANARSDIPYLLDQLDTLTAANAQLDKRLEGAKAWCQNLAGLYDGQCSAIDYEGETYHCSFLGRCPHTRALTTIGGPDA